MNSVRQTNLKSAERDRSAFFVARNWIVGILLLACCIGLIEKGWLVAQDRVNQSAEEIKKWIGQLEDDSFLVREQAKTRLKEAGASAFSQLYRARERADLEARLTIEEIISQIKIQWIGFGDSKRVIDIMLDFQTRRPEDRLAIVDRISWYSQGEAWQPLYRIAIYDKSREVSSYAAARLLQICFVRDNQPNTVVKQTYQTMSGQRFGSVASLLNSDAAWGEKMIAVCFAIGRRNQSIVPVDNFFLQAVELQKSAARAWSTANRKSPQIRASLILANRVLFQLASGLTDESLSQSVLTGLDQASLELVTKETEASEIVYVLDLLVHHSRLGAAEKVVDSLDVDQNPWHGFWKAEILRRQGNENESLKAASEAAKRISNGNEELAAGIDQLTEWNLDYWSMHLLKQNEGSIPLRLHLKLAELETESGELESANKRAAMVFEQSESDFEKVQSAHLLAGIANQNRQPRIELQWLNRVLTLEPLSASALVNLSRLSEKQIEMDANDLRQKLDRAKGAYRDQYRLGSQMAQSSTPAEANLGRVKMGTAANSLAWLLFNLDEETEEATRMAKMAVQLEPRNAAYLDTLAFGEFKFGSKEKAVSLQKRAVFLAPGDKSMKSRLQKYMGRN